MATKLIPELAHLPYEDRLKELGLTTPRERRQRRNMVEVYKLLPGMDKLNAGEEFLKLESGHHRDRTRGHALKLQKPRYRTFKRNNVFSARVVDQWNKLPEEIVSNKNVDEFKKSYDKHLSIVPRRGSTS